MDSRNPVFSHSQAFSQRGYAGFNEATQAPPAAKLEEMYAAPSATGLQTGRMTMDDVVVKTGLMFAVLLVTAGVNYVVHNPILTFGGLIAGLVLGLVVSFKQSTSPGLILGYSAAEGLFIGGLSWSFEQRWPGIVAQAVLATLAVFAVSLFAYKSGRIRVTPKFQRGVIIAMGGYLVFCVVNFFFAWAGAGDGWGLRSGGLGLAIGAFAVGLAAMMLILDFDFAERGVRNGLPERYAWLAAFGLIVTLVWLYVELLRLIAILRGD